MWQDKTLAGYPVVSIIIPTYRRFLPLLDTLDDVLRQEDIDFEIIVTDQNLEWPADCAPRKERLIGDARIRWMTLEQPGVVRARNLAVRESRGEILLFLDDDVQIPERWFLARHVANYADASVAAVVGREMRPGQADPNCQDDGVIPEIAAADSAPRWSDLPAVIQALSFDRNSERRVAVDTFCTCNSSIRRSDFLRVGGFDEHFTGNSYGDDYDLAIRLAEQGARILYDPSAALIHLQAPSGGLRLKDTRNKFSEMDKSMSACLFYIRHARSGCRWHLLYHHLLRKTILLRKNVVRWWRQPLVWGGVIGAWKEARRRNRQGPISIFGEHNAE